MTNLYEYTIKTLTNYNLHEEDVIKVLFNEMNVPIQRFWSIAKLTNYDSGFGINYIDTSLTLITKYYILAWDEYDGSEGWRVIKLNGTGEYEGTTFDDATYARNWYREE